MPYPFPPHHITPPRETPMLLADTKVKCDPISIAEWKEVYDAYSHFPCYRDYVRVDGYLYEVWHKRGTICVQPDWEYHISSPKKLYTFFVRDEQLVVLFEGTEMPTAGFSEIPQRILAAFRRMGVHLIAKKKGTV